MTYESLITNVWNLIHTICEWAEDFWEWGFTETTATLLDETYTFQPFLFLLASGVLIFLLIRVVLSINS